MTAVETRVDIGDRDGEQFPVVRRLRERLSR
jgi:hypothetical protein